jgi:hypothetical protein
VQIAASHGPDWAAVVTAISTAVLALGVFIAVFQVRELKRARHLQWIFEIARRWDDDKLEASRLALQAFDREGVQLGEKTRAWLALERHDDPELEKDMILLTRLPDFFEDVALMVDYGRLDLALVWQSLSGPAQVAWKAWCPAVQAWRELSDRDAYTEFERVAALLAAFNPTIKPTLPQRLRRWAASFF